MGYYTNFSGSIVNNNDPAIEKLVALSIAELPYFKDWKSLDPCETIDQVIGEGEHKWYNYKEDMLEISKMFPDLIICIHGEGETQGDVWNHYFQNGKSTLYNAELFIPQFNFEDLK